MATFSWAVNRLRVFLGMGEPPLEIVAYSSGPFFPFRLKQDRRPPARLRAHGDQEPGGDVSRRARRRPIPRAGGGAGPRVRCLSTSREEGESYVDPVLRQGVLVHAARRHPAPGPRLG